MPDLTELEELQNIADALIEIVDILAYPVFAMYCILITIRIAYFMFSLI